VDTTGFGKRFGIYCFKVLMSFTGEKAKSYILALGTVRYGERAGHVCVYRLGEESYISNDVG
jgi:hypothetical protein